MEGETGEFPGPLNEKERGRKMNVLDKLLLHLTDPGASLGSVTLSLCDLGQLPSPL